MFRIQLKNITLIILLIALRLFIFDYWKKVRYFNELVLWNCQVTIYVLFTYKLTFAPAFHPSSPIQRNLAQSVGHLIRKSGVLGSIPGLATYFRFSFGFFKEGQLPVTCESMFTKYWLTA